MKAFKFFRVVLALVHLILLIFLFFASIFLLYIVAGGSITYPFEIGPDIVPDSKTSLLSFLSFFLIITAGYFYFFTVLRKLAQSMGGEIIHQGPGKGL